MKQDITNRKDIEKLIDAFYSKATQDELIVRPVFANAVPQ
jgi:truncated hemoglobin YjbI